MLLSYFFLLYQYLDSHNVILALLDKKVGKTVLNISRFMPTPFLLSHHKILEHRAAPLPHRIVQPLQPVPKWTRHFLLRFALQSLINLDFPFKGAAGML